MVQGELFREEISIQGLDHFNRSQRSFLARYQLTLSLDKLVLLLISMVFIFALTYSFGVEHGKRSVEQHLQSLVPAHSETLPVVIPDDNLLSKSQESATLVVKNNPEFSRSTETISTNQTSQPAVQTKAAKVPLQETVSNSPKTASTLPLANLNMKQKAYTVQLVTYNSEEQAAKEITRLRVKGQESFIIPSGRFFQVCANYFENLTKARTFLKEFQESNRYPDAFIRPVVR